MTTHDDGWISDPEEEVVYNSGEPKRYSNNFNERSDNGRGRTRGAGRGRGSRQSQTFTNSNWRDRNATTSKETTELEIDNKMVGRIIGRGGAKIRDLEADSQAKIIIRKPVDGGDKTTISLVGTPEARDCAKILIERLVEHEYKPRDDHRPRRSEDHNAYGGASETEYADNPPQEEEPTGPIDWQAAYRESVRLQEEHWATLGPIIKDFYWEDPEVAGLTEEQVAEWRWANNNVSVDSVNKDGPTTSSVPIPNPVATFEQCFSKYPEILEEIRRQNFTTPSPIQGQAWPILLKGHDMIGIAQTGTGKTLAFLLPALIHIEGQPTPMNERLGPNVLVLAPTRELALQIKSEVDKYHYRGIRAVCIYGGGDRNEQIESIARGVQIVIATPGRLNDLVKARKVNLESVTYLVLDEADRMLDMGFEPQIRVSTLSIRTTRQTVMTSATWPSGVQRLANNYLTNPLRVVVGSLELAAVHSVTQELIFVEDNVDEKYAILLDFFYSMSPDDRVIVFCSRKATAIHIASDTGLKGIHYQSIYGGLDQCDREQALEDMRNGEVNILIATDIASRGIDIENITHIINFDFPNNMEEFVHRVGRTGRAGKKGKAISYITRRNWDQAGKLIKVLEEAHQFVPQQLRDMAERYENRPPRPGGNFRGGGRGRGGGNWGHQGSSRWD